MNNIYTLTDSGNAIEYLTTNYPEGTGNLTPVKTKNFEEITDSIEKGHTIFCDGMNCLLILKILTLKPGFFSKVILYEPAGAFWWRDNRFDVTKDFDTLDFFEWIETPIELISSNPLTLSAWSSILLRSDLTVNFKGHSFKAHTDEGWLKLAELAGISMSAGRETPLRAKGKAYIRNLSCEIEWEDEDRDNPGNWKRFTSIISPLGWQWESHWNVYTEDAPFGLMLSMLTEYLQGCIEKFHYMHSRVEWEWDGSNFFISKVSPAYEHKFHRCLVGQGTRKILLSDDEKLYDYVREKVTRNICTVYSSWDSKALEDNEPFIVYHKDTPCINADVILSRYNNTGYPGKCGSSPLIRFRLFKFLRSLPAFYKLYRSKRYFKDVIENYDAFRNELKIINSSSPDPGNDLIRLFERYYLYLMRGRLIYFSLLKYVPGMRANYEKDYKKLEREHIKFSEEFFKKLDSINPDWCTNIGYKKIRTIWQDTGKPVK